MATQTKNPIAKDLRTPKYKKRTVESKKKKQQTKRHKFRELEDWIEEHMPFSKNDIGC